MAVEAQTALNDDVGFNRHRPVQPPKVSAGQCRIPFPAASFLVHRKGGQSEHRRRAQHLEVGRIHIIRERGMRHRLGEGDLPGESVGTGALDLRILAHDRQNVRRGLNGHRSHHRKQYRDKNRRYKLDGARINYYI